MAVIKSPLVSIIIPIFRTENYLYDCLQSVKNQTMQHFEAILVNDATPDNAMKIAHEFAEIDDRFKIIGHDGNKGLGAARNTGIRHSKGAYLFFLDSDDELPKDALLTLFSLAIENDADMIVGNMAWKRNSDISPVEYIDHRFSDWNKFDKSNLRQLPAYLFASGSACHKLIRTSLVKANLICFSEGIFWEDATFSMETWLMSERIFGTKNYVYYRTERNDPDNPSIRQSLSIKILTDRDLLLKEIYQITANRARQVGDAVDYGITTLDRTMRLSLHLRRRVEPKYYFPLWAIWFIYHYILTLYLKLKLRLLQLDQ